MTEGLIRGDVRQDWKPVPVVDVVVRERQRKLNDAHVKAVRESFDSLGGQLQLQPIVVDADLVLIDGRHRLEAARQAGWEHISALILQDVTPEDRALLEAEANRVRLQLTPLEIEEAWTKIYEPAFKSRAKAKQAQTQVRGHEIPVIGNSNNRENAEVLSLPQSAKQVTGISLDTINKITDIRQVAQSESAPEELREAAEKGLKKLQRPGASVDAVHKSLLQLQERASRSQQDPAETQRLLLEKRLDKTLSETTLLQERLGGELGQDLMSAARGNQVAGEQLRAIRIALTHGLSRVVAIECRLGGDPSQNLARLGGEVTRMLSEETIRDLELEAENG
ncbi:ParB N-terminal domain-containing protein [Leucobacter sp. gxy201]|uniref:ParB N-terminal domain-containing protein n=1 Tax=Leucobacter sp. gxy201 TaxID=2957200 RepID=UPI003D9FEB43